MSGALVLDSEGLAQAVQRGPEVQAWLTAAREADLPVITSAAVLVEVIHPGSTTQHWGGRCPGCGSSPLHRPSPSPLPPCCRTAGLHGHKYAIDAMLCATALAAQPGRVTILTSDVEDISVLTTGHPRVSVEKV